MIGTKILSVRRSKFNGDLKVVRSFGLGTYIQAGGLTQSGGIVESIWKSTLKKIKSKEIEKVLILGLGGGTVAKLTRKYWPGAEVMGIDIDPMMIELGEKYLGLGETDVKIKIQDAGKPIPGKFDLVIVDLYQGDKFPKKFEDEKFLESLTKNKLVIFNRLYYGDKRAEAVKFGLKLQKIFKKVEYYYPEANLMFLCYNR